MFTLQKITKNYFVIIPLKADKEGQCDSSSVEIAVSGDHCNSNVLTVHHQFPVGRFQC